MPYVLVWTAITEYHRLVGLNNIFISYNFLEAGKSEIWVSALSGFGESSLSGLQ